MTGLLLESLVKILLLHRAELQHHFLIFPSYCRIWIWFTLLFCGWVNGVRCFDFNAQTWLFLHKLLHSETDSHSWKSLIELFKLSHFNKHFITCTGHWICSFESMHAFFLEKGIILSVPWIEIPFPRFTVTFRSKDILVVFGLITFFNKLFQFVIF